MNRFADEILKAKDELIHIQSTDNGKAAFQSAHDVDFTVNIFRYNAGAAERLEGLSFSRDAGEFTNNYGYVRKEPVGVCGLITPWNFPLLMTTFKMAPMLAAGCTAVFKPPELAPLAALKLGEIWTNLEGSVPGVVNMLPGIGSEAGEAIVDHPDVNMIHFTGSTAIG
jgi:acyl-CoA reductase-like NAD-dependent aldehyde dehydrogenase